MIGALTMTAVLAAGLGSPAAAPPSAARTVDVPPSAYRGTYWHPQDEPRRRCIVERESGNRPDALSAGGHGGLYQMTPALWEGAVWMMRTDPLDPITYTQRIRLQSIPVTKASRYWQDRAFWTVWNYGAGARHWAGGRWSC